MDIRAAECPGRSRIQEISQRTAAGGGGYSGVRSPDLKKLAKEILAGDWRGYLAEASDGSHEERLLQGLVIAGAWRGMDREELFRRTEEFVAKIDSWAICDAFCGAYKAADGGLRDAVWSLSARILSGRGSTSCGLRR